MNGNGQHKETKKNGRIKAVRNIALVYFVSALVTGKYRIFSSLCASFPFIFPVIFEEKDVTSVEKTLKSFIFGVPGILASVLFAVFTDSYSTEVWLSRSAVAFFLCVLYNFPGSRLPSKHRNTAKCIISIWVLMLAFV